MDKIITDLFPKPMPEAKDQIELSIKEVLQSLTLLGLWRAKFFEKAAFYGGTALRILYGLKRFSEDLDFSLLQPDPNFSLQTYGKAIVNELKAFGFEVKFEVKEKSAISPIESAFLKGDTINQFLLIEAPQKMIKELNRNSLIKIKIEIDTLPPNGFTTEMKYIFSPVQFAVKTYTLPSLFAGKLHALLFRKWNNRVKGRDWYDFVWYVSNYPIVDIKHLEYRMRQSGDYDLQQHLELEQLRELLKTAIEKLDIQKAKDEVSKFIIDQREIELWSKEFFGEAVKKIRTQ